MTVVVFHRLARVFVLLSALVHSPVSAETVSVPFVFSNGKASRTFVVVSGKSGAKVKGDVTPLQPCDASSDVWCVRRGQFHLFAARTCATPRVDDALPHSLRPVVLTIPNSLTIYENQPRHDGTYVIGAPSRPHTVTVVGRSGIIGYLYDKRRPIVTELLALKSIEARNAWLGSFRANFMSIRPGYKFFECDRAPY